MAVFWVVAPCSLVEIDRRFRGASCLHHQGDQRPDDAGSSTSVSFYQTTRRNIPGSQPSSTLLLFLILSLLLNQLLFISCYYWNVNSLSNNVKSSQTWFVVKIRAGNNVWSVGQLKWIMSNLTPYYINGGNTKFLLYSEPHATVIETNNLGIYAIFIQCNSF
jgi:hypothetical protein